jgi:hypothetical protein
MHIDSSSALTNFPYVYGGSYGGALFNTMDIDSSDNIVAGGSLKDSMTFGDSSEYPLIVFYNADSTYKWVNYYPTSSLDSSNTAISDIKFYGTT